MCVQEDGAGIRTTFRGQETVFYTECGTVGWLTFRPAFQWHWEPVGKWSVARHGTVR